MPRVIVSQNDKQAASSPVQRVLPRVRHLPKPPSKTKPAYFYNVKRFVYPPFEPNPEKQVEIIKRAFDLVAQYAFDCDDWVTIKVCVLNTIRPDYRRYFSRRDDKTRAQHLNAFEQQMIEYYEARTGIRLICRTPKERRALDEI